MKVTASMSMSDSFRLPVFIVVPFSVVAVPVALRNAQCEDAVR